MAKKPTNGGPRPKNMRADMDKPDNAESRAIAPELLPFFAWPGVKLAEAIGRLVTDEDRRDAEQAWREAQANRIALESDPSFVFAFVELPEDREKRSVLARGLMAKLRSGVLVISGNVNGNDEKKEINPIEWSDKWEFSESKNSATRWTPKTVVENVRVHLPAVAAVTGQSPKRSGRPPDEDWADITGEWLEIVFARGKPRSKAEAREWLRAIAVPKYWKHDPKPETFDKHMVRTFSKRVWDSLRADDPPPAD